MQRRASRKQLQSMQRAMLPKARGDGLPAERPAEAALSRPHRQDPSSDHTHPGASPAAPKQARKLKSRRTPYSEEELMTRRQTDTQRHLATAPNRSAHAGRSQISLLAGKRAHQEHQQGRYEKQRSRNPRVVPPTVGLRSPLQGIVPDVQAFAERQRSARSVHRRANATMLARISSLLTRVSTSMMALQSASNEVFGNVTLRMNLQAEGLSALSELWVEQPDQAALWPCGGQPSWNGATHPSLISLSAPDETDLDDIATAVRLGATEIEKSRFRRKLVRLAGVDALLPSAAEMRGATCPPKSMMLQYLNSSMPADERPRVVSDDGGPSWTEVGTLQSKVPVLALLALAGNTSKHGGSSTRQERERMLLVEAPMERGLRAPVSKGSLELWWWWWGPWWWWWRWWFWWWRPPKVRLEVSVNGQKPLPDRVYPSDKLMICIDVKDHWFTMPMVVALQPQEGNLPKCLFSPWPWAQSDDSYRHPVWYGWFWYFQRRRCLSMRCTHRGTSSFLTASRLWSWYDVVTPGSSSRFGIPLQGDLLLQRSGWDSKNEACNPDEHLPLAYEGGRASIGANWPNCNTCGSAGTDHPPSNADTDLDDSADDQDTEQASQDFKCSSVTANKDPRELARNHVPYCLQVGLSIPSIGITTVAVKAQTSSSGSTIICQVASDGLDLPIGTCDEESYSLQSDFVIQLENGESVSKMIMCRCRPGIDGTCQDVKLVATQTAGANEYFDSKWPKSDDASILPEKGCCQGLGAASHTSQGLLTREDCEERCTGDCTAFAAADDTRIVDRPPKEPWMRDTDERPCYTYRASPDIVGGWTQALVRGNAECPGSEKDLVCWKKPGEPDVFKPTKETLLRRFWERFFADWFRAWFKKLRINNNNP